MIEMNSANCKRNFFAIHSGTGENALERINILSDAAQKRNLNFISVDSQNSDYTKLIRPAAGDILVNATRGSEHLETLLMGPGVTTLRTGNALLVPTSSDTTLFSAAHDRLGLPGPKTFHHLPPTKEALLRYARELNGPPVILKSRGRSTGVGVILCSDENSLLSTYDYLNAGNEDFIMREYIEHTELWRLVVLGDEILCTLAHPLRDNDFRSAIDGTYSQIADPPTEIRQLAIEATKACGSAFAGVDIIPASPRGPLLLEANAPSNFASIYRKIGVDVAGAVVDYLLAKADFATRT